MMTLKPLGHELNFDDPNDVDWLYAWAQAAETRLAKAQVALELIRDAKAIAPITNYDALVLARDIATRALLELEG